MLVDACGCLWMLVAWSVGTAECRAMQQSYAAPQGTQMLRQAILQPSAKLPEIQKRHAAVEVHNTCTTSAPSTMQWRHIGSHIKWLIDAIMLWLCDHASSSEVACDQMWGTSGSWINEPFASICELNAWYVQRCSEMFFEGQSVNLAGATGGSSFGTHPTTVWCQGVIRWSSPLIKSELWTVTWSFWDKDKGSPSTSC